MFTLSWPIFQPRMQVAPPLKNQPELHPHMNHLYPVSKNSVKGFLSQSFFFESFTFNCIAQIVLAIIWLITQVEAPFEQILITHTQGLFVCNI